ncbi:uncharacterized protein LOC128872136 isoform X2 [Hylaeus volcanicus]|uniref:uncharacterized protein LOC128872136 isoform X2 n=1 Tax=Hylaeus volcanicus TaxID=313075 RepID=UPI0023B7F520|nr:uncharacterized protein LOC128872136 isoform X2 [Hylaeus volcanicus]
MEIEEEEEHQPVLTVGCQDNVGLQDSVGLKGFIDPDTSRDSCTYNVLPGSSRDCAVKRGRLQAVSRRCSKGNHVTN